MDKEKHWKGKKIKEAIFINAQTQAKEGNQEKVVHVEKWFSLDPIWGDFNAKISVVMQKKIGKCNCRRVCELSISVMEPD